MDAATTLEPPEWLEKANELARVLRITTACTCTYNIPYEGSKVRRVLVKKCQRCKVLEDWEKP